MASTHIAKFTGSITLSTSGGLLWHLEISGGEIGKLSEIGKHVGEAIDSEVNKLLAHDDVRAELSKVTSELETAKTAIASAKSQAEKPVQKSADEKMQGAVEAAHTSFDHHVSAAETKKHHLKGR